MSGQRRVILDKVETDYLRSQIDSADNVRIKAALQSLCKAYRSGQVVRTEQLTGIANSVIGTAYQQAAMDEKVRRWVLNAIARVCNEGNGIPAVLHIMKKYGHEPQTVASGIAAIYKLCIRQNPEEVLGGLNFEPQMRTLAALQHVPASKLDLRDLPIDVDTASSDILRLAIVVVGLDRSPENLLNPRHSDGDMVKVLGRHHDPIVSQYTVWAITENNKLGVRNLGIDVRDIESQPDNVRSWVFQLLAVEANSRNSPYIDLLIYGMSDPAAEARNGLAQGLKRTFVDVFEPVVLDWVGKEADSEVRQHLLEHIVRHADRVGSYKNYAIEIYEAEPHGSLLRQSMSASAVRLPIYAKFKQIDADSNDLFASGGMKVVKNEINIGSVKAGSVSIGDGVAVNYGATTFNTLNDGQIRDAQNELAKLEAALHEADIAYEQKAQALAYVKEAQVDTSDGKVKKVIDFISHIGSLAEAGTALAPYAVALARILGMT